MKGGLFLFLSLAFCSALFAQNKCSSTQYQQSLLQNDPGIADRVSTIEKFIQEQAGNSTASRMQGNVIIIPVVVHILYHTSEEKITDAQVFNQIAALNNYFRKRNSDTAGTPAYFRTLAADCEIEFKLALSDPQRRSTNGITRKYTPITKWKADDKMKFSAEMGIDAWDTKSYLNIWVCNLDKFAGYSSMPGADVKKDGLVISYSAFGTSSPIHGYALGKTAVHEIGHWLNLKHLWGDENCGDDGVSDTPKQASYTVGCPSTVRVTCGNGPYGDMYMNYMDFTNDACVNMFTEGQKVRMRAMFQEGGARHSILTSKGLDLPIYSSIPLPGEADPKWLKPVLYPNPASTDITLDLNYDTRWIGKNIFISNLQGQSIMTVMVTSKNQRININHLQAGVYFLAAKKDDGESIKMKFVKL